MKHNSRKLKIKKKLSLYTYKLKLLTEIKIHPIFYINLLQPLKRELLTHKIPPLPPIIVDNGNGSYFIDLINDI